MIKSRFNTGPSWTILMGLSFFILIFCLSIYSIYSNGNFLSFGNISSKVYFYLSLVGILIFLLYASSSLKIIFIDNQRQKIEIKNIISRQILAYKFPELDGYYDMAVKHGGKITLYYKAIGIVKNGDVVLLIDSYYYSNITDLRESLSGLKYLGSDNKWKEQNF